MLAIGLIVVSAAAGAFLYRARGGGVAWPHAVEHGLWALLLTAPLWPVAGWWVIPAAALVYGATTMGHGSGLDMGQHPSDDPDELRRDLWAPKDNPAHDTLFMSVSGTLILLAPATTAAYFINPLWMGLVLAGAMKGPCYYGSWRLTPAKMDNTAVAELAFGAVAGGACAAPWVQVLPGIL